MSASDAGNLQMSASDGPTLTRNCSSRRFGHHNNELQLSLIHI